MNIEDFQVVVVPNGRTTLRVPELPQPRHRDATIRGPACDMCVARWDSDLCGKIQGHVPHACYMRADQDGPPCIFIPYEGFEEYVVELVSRRVSS
jgi:hypothetical protein